MIKRKHWSIPYLIFLIVFVLLPLILVVIYAFQDNSGSFTFDNITKFFTDDDAIGTFALSIEIAIETTLLCVLLGYPAAWILSNKKYNKSAVTIVLFIMPMWINALMRTLATTELFNMLGMTLGKGTLLFGMVYDYLPFMIYP
ncbi:MAG: ABC transporter permease, partial [Bacteroidales bacterium]|nr:ABC transporter permease [Bacteroidales bacterium]